MQFHMLSFEGPDTYSRAGGLASRADGLVRALASLGFETHLWFVGDPELPGHESSGSMHLHRWAQWVSRYHPGGVYDGEWGKQDEYSRTLPPFLLDEVLLPAVAQGEHVVVLAQVAEEIARRLTSIFLRDAAGRRPVYGGTRKFQDDPHWRDHLLFYEYFHGDNGAGLGASHQTGWTGIIARMMHLFASTSAEQVLELGKAAAVIEEHAARRAVGAGHRRAV